MIRLSTPMVAAAEATIRARWAIATALGILHPSAVSLRDGRIRLSTRRDLLDAQVARGLEQQLARRAGNRVSDDRLLAQSVAILGAEVARARGQEPGAGATAALDRYLAGPGLTRSQRAEAQAMLPVALAGAAANDPAAAERLRRLPQPGPVVRTSEIVGTAGRINLDAEQLGAPRRTPTSHRRQRGHVGGRHRAPQRSRQQSTGGRRLWTSQIRGTGLERRERPAAQGELTAVHALDVVASMNQAHLPAPLAGLPPTDEVAVLRMPGADDPQYVRVEVGDAPLGALASSVRHAGTATDPHVVQLSSRLTDEQLRVVWANQTSQLSQDVTAERPHGLLGKLRSAFGSERRDRRVQADDASLQLLLRDWHQARADGQPVADLQRDIEGLARTIKRHGGYEPALPWKGGLVVDPQVAAFGVEAGRVYASANAAPHTSEHLRGEVVRQIEVLRAAADDLEMDVATKRNSSLDATAEAAKADQDAADEDLQRDRGAPERARQFRVRAAAAQRKAVRHTTIADGYERAAGTARQTLAGYRQLLTEIDQGASPARIAELSAAAERQVQAYERSLDTAMPVKDLLLSGTPDGQPPAAPTDDINRILAAHGIGRRIPARGPAPLTEAEYRRVLSRDGVVFDVGNDPDAGIATLPQVRLRLVPRDLTEITNRDYEMAEAMTGALGEGGNSFGTTNTHSTSANFGVNLGPAIAVAAPGTPLHLAAQVASPRLDASVGATEADASGFTTHAKRGGVDDNRGESLLYEWSGTWEIEVRKSPTDEWSPLEAVEAGRNQTWVSSAYSVPAARETVSLDEIGRGRDVSPEFPRHTVTGIDGLQDVTDRLVRRAQQQYGDLDRVAYDHIAGLIVNDSHRLLGEMSLPGGITRRIPTAGATEYELTWEVEPVWADAELVGESSFDMWQENVQVDFAGTNSSQTSGTSATVTAGLSAGTAVTALSNVGGSGANLAPTVSAGRNVSRSGGQNVSSTAITPAVHRCQGPTQGVLVGLNVRATLRKVDDRKASPIVETDNCKAMLRVPENDLLRAGGRADTNAVPRNPDGSVKFEPDGRLVLRGDPAPTTEEQHAPPWMGYGPDQLRGVGKALPQNVRGAPQLQAQAIRGLRKLGLVPPHGKTGPDDLQNRNYQRVVESIDAARLGADMNEACQGGVIVMLEDRGLAGTPKWRPFRLTVTQDHDETTGELRNAGAGVSENENVVLLGISSRATGRTSGRSKALPLSAGIGGTRGPATGISGLMGRLGLNFTRTARGRNFGFNAGRRVNRVTLSESTEPLDRLAQGITMKFAEITDDGDATPLAEVRGSMQVAYDSSMSRADRTTAEATDPKPPHDDAVQQAIPVAVDAGNIADELHKAIPAFRADSTALASLHKALSPASLVANREWLNGEYKLPFSVVRAPGNPAQMVQDRTMLPAEYQVVIRGTAISQTHRAMSQQNTVDINFTMDDVGSTSGTSSSGGIGGSAGGGTVGADGTGHGGGTSLSRTGSTAQSTTISETGGDEELLINPGTHHEFVERFKMTADILRNGKVVGQVELPDARVQKAMAERRALELYAAKKLDLPLWVVSDAAERYLNDRLPISHRTAAAVLLRYQHEKRGVTTGLAAEHTTRRLMTKLAEQSRLESGKTAQAKTAEEQFAELTQKVIDRADERRVVHTSQAFEDSLGASAVESVRVNDKPFDPREQVRAQIESVAPGLLAASPQLQNALDVDLDPRSFQGHLNDMLGPGGFYAPIEVPVPGQARPDVLFVRVRARFTGERTMDNVPDKPVDEQNPDAGTQPDIPGESVGKVRQKYDYQSIDRQVGHTTSVTVGLDGKGAAGGGTDLSGGLSTDQTKNQTAGSGEQNTTIDRLGHFDLVKTHRAAVFTTEVVRIRNAGAAAQTGLRWRLGRIDPADITTVSDLKSVRADLTQWIPRGDLLDGPAPDTGPETPVLPDHRRIELPEGAVPIRIQLHARDRERRHELLENLTRHLEQPGLLGKHGAAAYEHLLHTSLTPTALAAKTSRMFGPGIDLQPMARPGNGKKTVNVHLQATAIGFELHGPEVEGQVGRVWRHQKTYKTSNSGNRLTPVTATAGVDGGLVSVGGSVGEQVKEQASDANGTRLETSRFLEGQLVTVRIPVRYDATIRTSTDNGRGEPVPRHSTKVRDLARGEVFVRMLGHQYLDVLRQMERGSDLDTAIADAQLRAEPADFGRPDRVVDELQPGKSGMVSRPYTPVLELIQQAQAEERTLVLLVRQADGQEQKYRATKDGLLECEGDPRFGPAFERLHPTVVRMAEGRVDLHELHNTAPPGNFNGQVAQALMDNGVPRDVLKGLDYQTTVQQMAYVVSHSARTHSGGSAGHTISPSHGTSLAGP
ncbi:hypothetical protein ACFV9C_35360 [Kribbella sp. NPDC059898]|uniref:hypothetical protein n=1 Tax=Kribbella sp. NPDC059898 TaxID=3346995 RepID=UPI00365026B8